jgi:hypothetical protein
MGAPYVAFHGIDLTSLTDGDSCVSESGGDLNVERSSLPDLAYAELSESGREMVTFSFEMTSFDRSYIEEIVAEINTSPREVEFYPRDADRCVYAGYAHASRPSVAYARDDGIRANLYTSNVDVYCRSGEQFGDEVGSGGVLIEPALPYETATLTNSGYYKAPIDYLYASGYYDANDGYTDELILTIGAYELLLCNQLMRDDGFKLDRYGNVEHTYYTEFPKIYSEQQIDVGGSTYFDYGTGGSVAYQLATLGNNATFMMPFHGPLPIKENPYLEVTVTRLVGNPTVMVAFNPDLSDAIAIDVDLVVGVNKIWIPECDGEGFVTFGIQTGADASIDISDIYGEVNRYVAVDDIPLVDMDEDFTIKVGDGEFSNHKLEKLQVTFRSSY